MREKSSNFGRLPLGLALLLCGLSLARGGYIFTEEPLVRVSPAVGDSDLFGYAVALHRVDDTGATFYHAINNTKILVGAPSGTYPGGLPVPPDVNVSGVVNRTGLVYACPITPGDCDSVSGNGVGNDVRMFDYEANALVDDLFSPGNILQDEDKEGQFMGATIISTGQHVMVCAPRWINFVTRFTGEFDKTRVHGRCFYSGRNMTNFALLQPCNAGSSQSQGEQAYCMAGTAATIYEREPSSTFSVFLGSPPYDNSHGAAFQYDLMENGNPNVDPGTSIPIGFDEFFLYGGFSVAVGRIFSSDEKDLVYSLPKNNSYRGEVVVHSLSSSLQAVVGGEQMGEYFGWVVATADLNGDNYDEVIVGAPLFSARDKIEKGRIFIYKNNGTGSLDTDDPIVITGTVMKGRFGSAIVNLGDINSDGFEDIAVSAPFEKQEDEAEGTVYIYLGSGETYINEKPEETIRARDISDTVGLKSNDSLQSFGYSLSSGVDVDANLYNDLVIGGYRQQTVVVLRTQSIANITLSLSTDPEEQLVYNNRTCPVGNEMFACFNLLVNASFSGRGLDDRTLEIMLIVREVLSGKQRLFFLDSLDNRVDTNFTENLKFNKTDEAVQKTITIYVENDIVDRRSNLNVMVEIPSLERQQRRVNGNQDIIDLRDIPILIGNNMSLELALAGCAQPICKPDLKLTLNEVRYLDAGNKSTDSDDILAGEVKYVEVVLDYQTLTEDAINTSLAIALPSSLLKPPASITSTTLNQPLPNCKAESSSNYTCELERKFADFDEIRQVVIRFPVQDVRGNESDDTLYFTIKNEQDNDEKSGNNAVNVTLAVSARASVTFQEQLNVNPNMSRYGDNNRLGQRLTARTTIVFPGPSIIPKGQLTFYIPGKTEQTGDFYYLYPSEYTSSPEVACTGLNPDNFTETDLKGRRRRRSPSTMERLRRMVSGEHRITSGEHEQKMIQKREIAQTVNCAVDRDSCTAIVCSIVNAFNSSISFSVTSKVDNRFFHSQKGDFEFYIYAEFNILDTFIEGKVHSTTSNKILVQAPPPQPSPQPPPQPEDEEIPIWVFIVAVLGGLIVLVGIIILLIVVVYYFRNKTKKRINRERERRRSLHGNVTATTTAGPVVTSLDEKPEKPDEIPEKPDEHPLDDVEGTDDETAEGTDDPDDPDETEL